MFSDKVCINLITLQAYVCWENSTILIKESYSKRFRTIKIKYNDNEINSNLFFKHQLIFSWYTIVRYEQMNDHNHELDGLEECNSNAILTFNNEFK